MTTQRPPCEHVEALAQRIEEFEPPGLPSGKWYARLYVRCPHCGWSNSIELQAGGDPYKKQWTAPNEA